MREKPRQWWIGALLSLVRPGLGQIYNGQARKGITFLIIGIIFIPFLDLEILSGYPSREPLQAMVWLISISAVFIFLVVSDAIFYSIKKRHHYQLEKYNKIVVYAAVILCGMLPPVLVPSMNIAPAKIKKKYVQAYKIPSKSMLPALLPGDFILVDRRLPARKPVRGEIIVFLFPLDETKDFINRVVAVEGDRVEIRDKRLYVNNTLVKDKPVLHQEPEVLDAARSPRDNFGPITVPEDSFFVMGDNRDRAFDSRFWGVVEQSKIRGTARQIYWSWDPNASAIRWERIGNEIL